MNLHLEVSSTSEVKIREEQDRRKEGDDLRPGGTQSRRYQLNKSLLSL